MTEEKINAGVIGTGFMGSTHRGALQSLPHVNVCGIVSRTATGTIEGIPVFASVSELIENTEVDVVSVCTPTTTHNQIIKELADNGVHVISEKPLSLDVAQARELQNYCSAKGVQLHVAHVTRYLDEYRQLSELVSSGRLGRPGTVRMRRAVPTPSGVDNWFLDPAQSGGVTIDLLIHDADFLIGLFGLPTSVVAQRTTTEFGETVLATAKFSNGTIALLQGTWGGVTELEFDCEIAGSEGNAMFRSGAQGPLVVTRSLDHGNSSSFETPPLADPYALQLTDFIDAITSKTESNSTEQAILALQFCLMIQKACTLNRPIHSSDAVVLQS